MGGGGGGGGKLNNSALIRAYKKGNCLGMSLQIVPSSAGIISH